MSIIERLKQVEGDFMGYKSYSPIEVTDKIAIEVHANSMSNCTPQDDVPLEKYTHIELVVKKDNKSVPVEQIIEDKEVITDLGLTEYLDRSGQKYNFVPFEIVDKLYRHFLTINTLADHEQQEVEQDTVRVSSPTKEEAVKKINSIITALNK